MIKFQTIKLFFVKGLICFLILGCTNDSNDDEYISEYLEEINLEKKTQWLNSKPDNYTYVASKGRNEHVHVAYQCTTQTNQYNCSTESGLSVLGNLIEEMYDFPVVPPLNPKLKFIDSVYYWYSKDNLIMKIKYNPTYHYVEYIESFNQENENIDFKRIFEFTVM